MVQFSRVRIVNMNQLVVAQSSRDSQAPASSSRVSRIDQDQQGRQEKSFAVPLNEVKVSEVEDSRPVKPCKASYASPQSLSTGSYLYPVQTACALLPTGLVSACESLSKTHASADFTLPIGLSLEKRGEATRTQPEALWCVSLWNHGKR